MAKVGREVRHLHRKLARGVKRGDDLAWGHLEQSNGFHNACLVIGPEKGKTAAAGHARSNAYLC